MNYRSNHSAISNEFHNFLADIETLVKDTASLSGDELSIAKEKLSQRIASAKASAVHMGDDLATNAGRIAHNANAEIHAEPWKAIGAGAALGLVLGLLFARR